ncbi:MAG TPA: ATP-binding protein [Spirochaetales bacterium]|nr:ATP-binding protein [Spirochaetales bacterium]HQG39811.1 ATP-binding protein [Spirochaetales bacterium]
MAYASDALSINTDFNSNETDSPDYGFYSNDTCNETLFYSLNAAELQYSSELRVNTFLLESYAYKNFTKKIIFKRNTTNAKNIAKMFHANNPNDTILHIDEIDSFLFKRKNVHQSWEISKVNEFFSQMDQYQSIFIATTNNYSLFDEAVIRRFQQKIEFLALTTEGVLSLLKIYFPAIKFSQSNLLSLLNNGPVYPSDFQTVAKNISVMGGIKCNKTTIITMLLKESKLRNYNME